jgi:predicted short-subunit dehydrogenase-like oxidoreductase (DUF2520 family)
MKIVLIGTGNLAIHLGPALKASGHSIIQVVGRTVANTQKLAEKIGTEYTTDPKLIDHKAEVYIICVRDEAISFYANHIPKKAKLVLHTSGSLAAGKLAVSGSQFGVLYPLQTFSKHRKVNFKTVPLCLEASTSKSKKILLQLALSLSKNIHWLEQDQRQSLHLAAVFANNFSNHLFVIAEELLRKKKLSFDLLRPLIAETAAKIQDGMPHEMQTGPARRGDSATIDKHIALLKNKKQISEIYKILTKSILDHDGPRF